MKKNHIILPAIAALIYLILTSYSAGPGLSGIHGTVSGCGGGSCHGSSATASTTVTMQLFSGATPVTTYVAGGSYTVRITGTQTSGSFTLPNYGFQVATVNGSGSSVGSMSVPLGTHSATPAGVTVIEQNSPIGATTGSGGAGTTYVMNIPWTAPSSGTGNVTLRGVINAVNGGAADAGDKWNTGNTVINELTAITGTATICVGSSSTLSSSPTGGTWSSSNTIIATVSSGGLVSGISTGTATISYSLGGNTVTRVVTVSPSPGTFSGSLSVCATQSTILSNSVAGGTWTSGATSIATVGSSSGIVNGVAAGTANITYAVGTCTASVTVTVNPQAPITGSLNACLGASTALANAVAGGTWSSSNTAVGTISTGGSLSALGLGTTNITYSLPTGCNSTATVTVNPTPAAIDGTLSVCVAGTATATNPVSGGTWSSSSGTGSVTINATTGSYTGNTAGTATITYTISGGCNATAVVTVNSLPGAITGGPNVCANSSITLNNTVAGGTWASGTTTVATIGSSSGIVAPVTTASGSTLITYTLPTGCRRITTVNVLPISPISGTLTLCLGTPGFSSPTLTSAPTGGTWSSGTTSVASIGSSTGIISAAGTGTSNISYTTGSGCIATAVATVIAAPTITGASTACVGTSITYSSPVSGGTWASSNTTVATINASSGLLDALTTGTTSITYTPTSGCYNVLNITVNPTPAAISGPSIICDGTTATYTNSSSGTWASSNVSIVSINSTTGIATGLVIGTSNITFTSTSGCTTSRTVTVLANPAAIAGPNNVCIGSNITATNITSGGTWSASNTNLSINTSTGVITGNTVGTSIITYTASSGCFVTRVITINALPGAISGPNSICVGATGAYTNATAGGTWSSSSPAIGSIASSGILSGLSSGITSITYTLPSGCFTTKTVTINATPNITGVAAICVGQTNTLSSAISGGTWSEAASAISVDAATGVITGLSAGTATVTYTLATGCAATAVVTVNTTPTSISGATTVCVNSNSTLSATPSGGTWSSSNTAIGTINSSTGSVRGISAGTTIISYTLSSGCFSTSVITVNPQPDDIIGILSICVSSTSTLSSAPSGGTWSSTNASVATVGSSTGIVSAASTGTSNITYTSANGCLKSVTATVHPLPGAISGPSSICVGNTGTFSSTPAGGLWSSSNTSVATIGSSSGLVLALSAGTTVITYTLGTGCVRTYTLTINETPATISGASSTCVGISTTLTNTTSGGTWSSSNTVIATVGTGTGAVLGVSAGTVRISYIMPTGCFQVLNFTVNPAPSAGTISGTTSICTGLTSTLSSTVSGGTWASSNTSVATISASGVVTGIVAGTATISYSVPTSCGTAITTTNVTITTSPTAGTISGSTAICSGNTTTLSSTVLGGTWSSSNTSVATVGSSSGLVSSVSPGTATISYSVSTGCGVAATSIIVTINPIPFAIAGSITVCTGATLSISTPSGGTWSSSNTSVATIDAATGLLTGISSGTSRLTYTTTATGCFTTTVATVHPTPGAISGISATCLATTTTLSASPAGGTWSSASTSVATIGSATGALTATATGTTTISYTLSTGCFSTLTFTVNPLPAAITGNTPLCPGNTITLANATSGGTWSVTSPGIASVDGASGIVTGVANGTTSVTYTLPTGCRRTATLTVNTLPATIIGTLNVCVGVSTTLINPSGGGTWSSSNTAVATIGSGSGIALGVSAGTSTITYTQGTGCIRTAIITINPNPTTPTGSSNLCLGESATMSATPAGGVWSISSTTFASINATTGLVSGLSAGTPIVTYALGTGCFSTTSVSINPLPSSISGSTTLCVGASATLSSTPSGGTWLSTASSVATIGTSGLLTAVSAGTSEITYTSPAGCIRTTTVNINPLPDAITGTLVACAGSTTTLASTTTGGTWSSATTSVATIASVTGALTAVSAGTSSISYTLPTGCRTTIIFTTNALPATITGTTSVCVGSTATLSSATTGGTWSTPSSAISVGSSSGIVTGVAAGTATITYTLATACSRTFTISINPLPSAGTITAPATICVAASATVTPTVSGGTWSTLGSLLSITGAGVITGITAGVDTVHYTVTNVCGTDIATATVSVNPLPDAGSISGPVTICIGSPASISATIPGGSWSSSATAVATVGTSGIVSGIAPGTAVISYAVSNSCGTDIDTINITIIAAANAGTISGPDSLCQGDSVNITTTVAGGSWSTSSAAIATVSSAGRVKGISSGTVTVSYIVNNACSADTETHTMYIKSLTDCTVGIKTYNLTSITFMPNPTNGTAIIFVPSDGVLTIYSMNGQKVATISVNSGINNITIPNNIAAGVYMGRYQSTQNDIISTIKFTYQP